MERLIKRVSEADCRQKQTGSCNGCPVKDIAKARRDQSDIDLRKVSAEHWTKNCGIKEKGIIKKVSRTLCPEGNTVWLCDDGGMIGPTGFGC